MTLQRQLKKSDKATWTKPNWYLTFPGPDVKIRFLSLNFRLDRWVISKAQLEQKFKFSCLGFTPKQLKISKKIEIFFTHRIINLGRLLRFFNRKIIFSFPRRYCFNPSMLLRVMLHVLGVCFHAECMYIKLQWLMLYARCMLSMYSLILPLPSEGGAITLCLLQNETRKQLCQG